MTSFGSAVSVTAALPRIRIYYSIVMMLQLVLVVIMMIRSIDAFSIVTSVIQQQQQQQLYYYSMIQSKQIRHRTKPILGVSSSGSSNSNYNSYDPTPDDEHHRSNEYHNIEFLNIESSSSSLPSSIPTSPSSSSSSLHQTTNSNNTSTFNTKRFNRLQNEHNIQQQFVPYSNALWELRDKCTMIQNEIQQYHNDNSVSSCEKEERIKLLQQKLLKLQNQDPDFVYQMSINQINDIRQKQQIIHLLLLQMDENHIDIDMSSSSSSSKAATKLTATMKRYQKYQQKLQKYQELYDHYTQLAESAKSCLPQYNYHGLWIGKYGNSNDNNKKSNDNNNVYDLINVTYVGEADQNGRITLIATKLTNHNGNVPINEISFQVQLHPSIQQQIHAKNTNLNNNNNIKNIQQEQEQPSSTSVLTPISLSTNAASKWGISRLSRYYGFGQVAVTDDTEPVKDNNNNNNNKKNQYWMNGQLIVINEQYFSFVWLSPTPTNSNSNTNTNTQANDPQATTQIQIFFGRPSPEMTLKLLSKNQYNHHYNHYQQLPTTISTKEKKIASEQQQDDIPSSTYEFPSLSSKLLRTSDNNNNLMDNIQYQKAYVSRCLELTYEEILDEIDIQKYNPYGNGIWHCYDDKNKNGMNDNDDDIEECYFE